jgi:hypothetical protein
MVAHARNLVGCDAAMLLGNCIETTGTRPFKISSVPTNYTICHTSQLVCRLMRAQFLLVQKDNMSLLVINTQLAIPLSHANKRSGKHTAGIQRKRFAYPTQKIVKPHLNCPL